MDVSSVNIAEVVSVLSTGAFLLSEIIGMSKLKSNSTVQVIVAILKRIAGKG